MPVKISERDSLRGALHENCLVVVHQHARGAISHSTKS
jgi:hypothetical protein